ncbi:SDR family NAD(P)-dependent oxidoreductase [Streptomyces sp. NPDC004126]|uniref:SDR family NAD(P)-dependent oxidoreductase n=1 Tax=Streptomyces sp. NPDC004126 TaxID=3390695 RepID=UPI003D069627
MSRALITGATEGIGRALALALAAEGHTVTAVARTQHRLDALLAELDGVRAAGHGRLAADLGTPEGLEAVAAELRTGRYDLLVNNAATAPAGPFAGSGDPLGAAGAAAAVRLNCEAVVTLAHAFLPAARPGAALVNVSSALAHTPKPGQALYGATKAFVTAFSDALWYEQRGRGVHVLALCPGPTATRPGLHSDAPSALVRTPEQVAAATLAALRERRRTVVPGRAAALAARAVRLLPRRTALALLAEHPPTPL